MAILPFDPKALPVVPPGGKIKLFYAGYQSVILEYPVTKADMLMDRDNGKHPIKGLPTHYSFDSSDRIKPPPKVTLNLGEFMPKPPALDLSAFAPAAAKPPPIFDLSGFMVPPFTPPPLDLSVWSCGSDQDGDDVCLPTLPVTGWFGYPTHKPERDGYYEVQMHLSPRDTSGPHNAAVYWRGNLWWGDDDRRIVAWRGLTERYTSLGVK